MGTQTTTIMTTKRSRHRTRRGTRGRRVARAAGLTPLTPAKTGIHQQLGPRNGVAARRASRGAPRGDERRRPSAHFPIPAVLVEAGDVHDAATLERWLPVMIGEGSGFCDAVFFVHAHRAAAERYDEALRAVAELAAVFAPSQERHLETTAQGRAFLDATRAAWPTPARSAAGGLGWSRRAAGCGRRCGRKTRYRARVRAAGFLHALASSRSAKPTANACLPRWWWRRRPGARSPPPSTTSAAPPSAPISRVCATRSTRGCSGVEAC